MTWWTTHLAYSHTCLSSHFHHCLWCLWTYNLRTYTTIIFLT